MWRRRFTIECAIWAVVIHGAALLAGCGSRDRAASQSGQWVLMDLVSIDSVQ